MAKSPDAFRTISEVSTWLGTQSHVLRFWEGKFDEVSPVQRAGGRRYYRSGDMTLIGGIKTLLHDQGMTIKAVQKLLKSQGIAHVRSFSPDLVYEPLPIVQKIVNEPSEANIIQSYNLEEQPFLFPELEEKFFNLSEEIDNNATSKKSKTYNNEKTSLGENLEKRDLDLNQFTAGQSPTAYVFNLSTSQRLSLVRRNSSIITNLQKLQSTLSA
jgi:DNA-binding transcriptional MerR regulator